MDNFKIIYRILKALEIAMDADEFDMDMISAERLKITENRWTALMAQLVENGYVSGISVRQSIDGNKTVSVSNPVITLKGLEYLEENSLMKKAAKVAKGIKDIVPGL